MDIPTVDTEKIEEATLALLFLGLHQGARAWKSFDWGVMEQLHRKGFITDPVGKARSVLLTEEGLRVSERLFWKLFGREGPSASARDREPWIVDLRHFLTTAGAMALMPKRVRQVAEFLASIVLDATTDTEGPPSVRCRRRAGQGRDKRRCNGLIMSYPLAAEPDCILWYCTECNDNGMIRGWQGTLWDAFAEKPAAS